MDIIMPNYLRDLGFVDGVKLARDMPSFLSQKRPAAVKKIYRALKREHPRMPAEMKARIAARQGLPGKQKQGPPYSGPITKSAGLVPKKALVAAGALAVPYTVGKKVQNRQQEQVMDKSAAFNAGVVDGMSKMAKEDDRPEPGFFARNMAATRAMRRGDKGVDSIIADPKLIGERSTRGLKGAVKGGLIGAGGGALAGALLGAASKGKLKPGEAAGIGAALGGLIGVHGGQTHGMYTADRDFLKDKGFTLRNLGLSVDMTDEAKKKFLHEKYRGGGYKG